MIKSLKKKLVPIIYQLIILRNIFFRFFLKEKKHYHLFILSPPYCGSTLLSEILCSSNTVSSNNIFDTREGQQLPKVKEVMFTNERWKESFSVDWEWVKEEWNKYWDPTKPVFLDKSPANILRAEEIERVFGEPYFIIFYRNPFAMSESLMRINQWSAEQSAKFVIKCLSAQKKNISHLKKTIHFSYEHLTDHPIEVGDSIIQFLPEIKRLNLKKQFSAHNFKNKKLPITNLNRDKFQKLKQNDIKIIEEVFRENKLLLSFFNFNHTF